MTVVLPVASKVQSAPPSDDRTCKDLALAKAAMGCFINDVYNTQPLHSALDDLSPVEF